MDWSTIGGLALRHGLTTFAGILVAHGYLMDSQVSDFLGAVMLIIGIILSWFNKQGHQEMKDELNRWRASSASRRASIIWLAILAAALAMFVGSPPVGAADMPIKARSLVPLPPPAPACTLAACSGWYVGGNLIGTGSNLDILGGGLSNSVFAGGGAVGADIGAQLWNGKYFGAFEAFGDYETVNNVQVTTAGMPTNTKHWMVGIVGKFGLGLAGLFGGVPTATATPSQSPVPITIPASIADALLSPYVALGEVWRPWGSGWASGAGADFILSQNWNLDLMYLHVVYGNATVNPGEIQKTDNLVKTALHYKF